MEEVESTSTLSDEEFVALVAQQQPVLRAIVRSMLPGASDLEDVLQETNMVLWRKRHEFEAGTRFHAWAGTVARFQVLAWLKRTKSSKTVGFNAEAIERLAVAAPEHFDGLSARSEALRSCLAELSSRHRELIRQRYFLRAPLSEYAERHGKTVAAVSKILERLRTSLRECINGRLAS